MNNLILSLVLLIPVLSFAKNAPLPTAENVDINRYMGKWYTITALPQTFTRNCDGQIADYSIMNEKEVAIKNTCLRNEKDPKVVQGKATVIDSVNHARMQVKFDTAWNKIFRIKGEYVILQVSKDYSAAMVGSTDRKTLWILSRTTTIDPTLLVEYKNMARDLKFPVTQLKNAKY